MNTSILFGVPVGLFAGHAGDMHGWGMDGSWMGGWGGWLGLAFMVVFALLLATLVLAFVRVVLIPVLQHTERSASETGDSTGALGVLRERFASGDIDEEEFERRATVLRRSQR